MGSSDVLKVRLTAEGIQDVVNSLKKIQTETQKTAKAGKDAGDALGALGTIFAAQQLAAFAAKALDAADALYKMSQKIGVPVEQLSVLSWQAQQADLSSESLEKGMIKLSKSLVALESGSAPTVEAFKRIGLAASDLKGISLDQVLLKIANAQAKYADGAGKAATMTELMGKSGANFIPLLNDMAGGGYDKATAQLKELGLVISTDMAKGAQDFNDSMKRMEMAAQGAAIQITQGMLPGMTKSITALTAALAGMPLGIKAFTGSFMAIGTAATAAAMGVRTLYGAIAGLGPIGLAVIALSALIAGVMAWNAAQEAAHAEQIKANADEYQRVKTGKELVDAYQKEAAALEKGGMSAKSVQEHKQKLKTITDELIKLSPAYKDALDSTTGSLRDQAEAVGAVNAAQKENLRIQLEQLKSKMADEEMQIRLNAAKQAQESYTARQQQAPISGEVPKEAETDITKANMAAMEDAITKSRAKYQAQIDALSGTAPAGSSEAKKPEIAVSDKTTADAMRKARAAEALAAAKREYEIQKQELDDTASINEDAYKNGLISLEGYLGIRARLIQQGAQAEVDMLNKQLAAEEASRDKATKPEERLAAETKIADLKNQILLKENEGASKLAANYRKGDEEREKAAREAIKLEAELEDAKGQTGDAAIRAIQAEYAERKKTGNVEIQDELEKQAILKKKVDIQQGIGNNAQANLGNRLTEIDQNEQAGTIGAPDATQQRIAAYKEYIGVINDAALAQKALADESGNPVLIQEADALIIKVHALKDSLAEVENEWAGVIKAGAGAAANGMVSALMEITNRTKSVSDAFRDMGTSICQAIEEAILKMMILKATQAMLGDSAAANGSGSWQALVIGAVGAAMKADGGPISGPGTATSDSIPALLSNGEFVLKTAAHRYYGTPFLAALNGMRIPKTSPSRFADGGPVGANAISSIGPGNAAPSVTHLHQKIVNVQDPKAIQDAMRTHEGEKLVLNILGKNTSYLKSILG